MARGIVRTSTGEWEVVIGLEVHAQIRSNAKLFSCASTTFAGEPNTQVSFVDAGLPGMLPVLNHFCVVQAVKTGLAVKGKINEVSQFDRKSYFYPDLPQGYQITQFYKPVVDGGEVTLLMKDADPITIGIDHIHLEQDAGKSIHDLSPTKSYIDLNRAGTALMEIVTRPDIRGADEAMAFVKKLRQLLRYVDSSDGNMQEGSLRADVNISVRRPGEPFGTRAEIKNVNSIRFIGQAIDYEVARQIDLVESGEKVVQETRLFDASAGVTRSMRTKEEAEDYRYFPDPDILPVHIDPSEIDHIRASLPELPDEKQKRFVEAYALSTYDAAVLSEEMETSTFFEAAIKLTKKGPSSAKLVCNWITSELFSYLKKDNLQINESPVTPQMVAELVDLIEGGTISGRIGKDIFPIMWEERKSPSDIVEEKGLVQISDDSAIEKIAEQVLQDNPDTVEKYKSGKDKLFGFFVGKVMKEMKGKANPKVVNDVLKKLLS